MVEIMTCHSFTNEIIKIMAPCQILKTKKKSYFEFLLIENKTQI